MYLALARYRSCSRLHHYACNKEIEKITIPIKLMLTMSLSAASAYMKLLLPTESYLSWLLPELVVAGSYWWLLNLMVTQSNCYLS